MPRSPSLSPKRLAMLQAMPSSYFAFQKSIWVAYLLWLFFGPTGSHRFYAADPGAKWQLLSSIGALLVAGYLFLHQPHLHLGLPIGDTVPIVMPAYMFWLMPPALNWLLDGFSVPRMIRDYNLELERCLAMGVHPDDRSGRIRRASEPPMQRPRFAIDGRSSVERDADLRRGMAAEAEMVSKPGWLGGMRTRDRI